MKTWDTVMTLSFLANCISRCPGFFSNTAKRKFSGQLQPMDPNVCTTQNITFTSELLQSPVLNFSIGFAVKTRHTNSKYVAVDYDRTVEVNETMSQFTIYNITLETEETATPVYLYVESYYWQEYGDIDDELQLGQTSSARVFPHPDPEQVQEFMCVVMNYVSMNCTWKYGKDYGENMPEVIFLWRNPSYTASWTECKDLNIENGYCLWQNVTSGYFKNLNLTMKITLMQKCGINASTEEFPIDTSKIVKPNPVSSLSSTVINSTCIQLFWNINESEPQHPKEHRVIVSSEGDNVTTKFISTTSGTEMHNEIICNLRPYTKYTFSVSMQPIGHYSGYFSDDRKHVSMTYSDIPSASPEVTEGGYNWNHRECEENNQERRVCIFWKSIKKEHENGPMKGVQALFTTTAAKGPPFQEDWAADSTYGCSSLLCNTSYYFSIRARNVNGSSKNGSTIKIPKFIPGHNPPQFIVESANTSDVYISLDNREKLNVNGFTVFWCRNENGHCENGRDVNWKHIDSNTKEVPLQINASSQDFLYGVSALTEEYGSSGVEWQDCVYLKNITPKREPQNVVVSAGFKDNTLDVTWDKLSCRADEPYIAMYNVRYNKLNQSNKKSINVTESGEARVVLKDLEEDQTYVVTVRGITKDERYGPESQPQTGVPVNKSLKPTEIAGISMAALVCAIFAGVGLFCVVRICKMKAKKVIQEAGHITIPDFPDLDNFTELRRQNSNDSGYDLTPPPEKVSNEIDLGFVRPDDYRYATIDHGKTIEDNGETSIDSDDTTIGNGDNKLTTTETYILEPEQTHQRANQPVMSVLPTVTSQSTRESKLMLEIPKPTAFNEKSDSGMPYSGGENNMTTGSLKDKLVDYIKCKNTYSDSIDRTQNLPTKGTLINNDSETNVEVADSDNQQLKHEMHQANLDSPFHLSNVQSLINIPCPNETGISNNAFTGDDDETSLTDPTNKCQQSRHIESPLSIVINSEIKCTKDYISHSNAVQENVVPHSNAVQDNVAPNSNAVLKNIIHQYSTGSLKDKLVDYIKCKNAYSDSIDRTQNLPTKGTLINNDSETNVEVADSDNQQLKHEMQQANLDSPFHLSNVQSLINIPCPNETGISNNAFTGDDNETSLTDPTNKCQQSRHIESPLSIVINSEIKCTKDYISHSNAVQENVVPRSTAVQDSVFPHSNAVQDNVVCNYASDSNITDVSNKTNGYVPHANIITDCMPSYAVYTPNGKMGTIADHGSHIDSHTIPSTCRTHKTVHPGYVFSTEGNVVCKDLENKIPLDFGYVEQGNTSSKNIDDKDFVSFQGYVDDRFITSLQTETLNVANSADSDGETNPRCIPMYNDGYVAHSILKEENDM